MNGKDRVRAKKFLGQHFLKDEAVARDIVDALHLPEGLSTVLEIGPGMGVLTSHLLQKKGVSLHAVELDRESVAYLITHFPELHGRLIEGDFLQLDLKALLPEPFAIIGNFPYNISTQILFRVLEHRGHIPVVVGMFQKEVAERIASPPGNRDYGILSVLLQPWYDIHYLFTVLEHQFDPPPRVKSAVISLHRNQRTSLQCSERFFVKLVKQAFSQRRKTLRNALKPLLQGEQEGIPYLDLRAEALSWQQFEQLGVLLEQRNG
jgi:16S rRNA (adenine1518-N6/adenine1519-N6)-dimethyltransferase